MCAPVNLIWNCDCYDPVKTLFSWNLQNNMNMVKELCFALPNIHFLLFFRIHILLRLADSFLSLNLSGFLMRQLLSWIHWAKSHTRTALTSSWQSNSLDIWHAGLLMDFVLNSLYSICLYTPIHKIYNLDSYKQLVYMLLTIALNLLNYIVRKSVR